VTSVAIPDGFWAAAPQLFEAANHLQQELERSDVTDAIVAEVGRIADAVPQTPDPLTDMDPYLRSALLTGLIHAMRAADARDRRQLRLFLETVRQALRDLIDERPVWRGGPKHAAQWLRQQGIGLADLVDLTGVSESSWRRWTSADDDAAPSGEAADRIVVLAKVVNHLRHAMTSRGAVQWLQRPHPEFDDRRPIDDLKDPDSYRHLIHAASGTRSSIAT